MIVSRTMYRYTLIAASVLAVWCLLIRPSVQPNLDDGRPTPSAITVDRFATTRATRTGEVFQAKAKRQVAGPRVMTKPEASGAIDAPESPRPLDPGEEPDALVTVATAIDEVRPLLNECYDLGRVARPSLSEATAMIALQIVSDSERSVVVMSTLGEGTDDLPTVFSECLLETMYRLPLPTPKRPESAVLTYPLHFVSGGVRTISDSAKL